MKNEKTYNNFTFSLFIPSKLIFREGSPDNADRAKAKAELEKTLEKDKQELLSKPIDSARSTEDYLEDLVQKLRNPQWWPMLDPKDRQSLFQFGTSIINTSSKKIMGIPFSHYVEKMGETPRAIIERMPKVTELDNLGKKLCEYAKNLPKAGKSFDLYALTNLTIIKEGNALKVYIVKSILSDLTYKTDYFFDATSGKYLKGISYINDKGKVTKHDESDPNELLKIVPPLITPINGPEKILNGNLLKRLSQ